MRSMHGFYLVFHSSGFITYLDLPSRQNTQKAGHVHFRGLLSSISHRRLPNSLFYLTELLRRIISAWLNWTWLNITGANMHSIR